MNPIVINLFLALGCTKVIPKKTEIASLTAQEQADLFLHPTAFRERVLVTHLETIRLQPDGAIYTAPPPTEIPLPQERIARKTEAGIEVLMTVGCDTIFFFAFVEQEELQRTAIQQSYLQLTPTKKFQKASLLIAPGVPITITECQQSMCQVHVNQNGYLTEDNPYNPVDIQLNAWGWIDTTDLGYVYLPENFTEPPPSACYSIDKGAKLYDATGASFLEFTNQYISSASLSSEQRLTIQQHRLTATGFINPEQIQSSECLPKSLIGGGCGWGSSNSKKILLSRRTPIFAEPNGTVIGVIAEEHQFIVEQQQPGWTKISLPTRWEDLYFWVATGD